MSIQIISKFDSMNFYAPFTGNPNDQSLYGAAGTVTNATLTTDKNGVADSAYSFATANAYIGYGQADQFKPTKFTASCWIKTPGGAVSNRVIFGQAPLNSSYRPAWCLCVVSNPPGNLAFRTAFGPGLAIINTGVRYTYNAWYHMVGTYDGSHMRFYLNGAQVKIEEGAYITYTPENAKELLIGAGTESSTGDKTGFWTGIIDDCRLYPFVFSLDDVIGLYNKRI